MKKKQFENQGKKFFQVSFFSETKWKKVFDGVSTKKFLVLWIGQQKKAEQFLLFVQEKKSLAQNKFSAKKKLPKKSKQSFLVSLQQK